MNQSRFKVLGLFALVLGLMAISAGAAHAEEPGAHWWIVNNEGKLKELEATIGAEFEPLKGEEEKHAVLLTEINGKRVELLCSSLEITNRLTPGGNISSGRIIFHGCITKVNGATQGACEPISGTNKGLIETELFHGLIVLHELSPTLKDDIILLLPDVGEALLVVKMGAECSIGTKIPLLGQLTLKDCEGLFLKHLVKHLIVEGPLTELYSINKTKMEHLASIDGSAWVFLTGEHQGLQWSGETN